MATTERAAAGGRWRIGLALRFLPSSLRNLGLTWKLLIPFLLVTLVMGGAGALVTLGYLNSRSEAAIEALLAQRIAGAEAYIQGQELYLREVLAQAGGAKGLAEAVSARSSQRVGRILQPVALERKELDLLVATDERGLGLAELYPSRAPDVQSGKDWTSALVSEVLGSSTPGLAFFSAGSQNMLAAASSIRTDKPIGTIVAGYDTRRLTEAAGRSVGGAVALYDRKGALVGASLVAQAARRPPRGAGVRTQREVAEGEELASRYKPLRIHDVDLGTLAVSVPVAPTRASAQGAAVRLAILLFIATVAVIVLGAILSNYIVAQVRSLSSANRAFGRGDLAVRAPVLTEDELGQLARGFNEMASQLQASHEELERRVEERTEVVRQLYEEVLEASRARDQFFAALSHEFRTPLFAISGHAQMMKDRVFDAKDPKWIDEYADTINEASSQLLGQVNEILELAKFESGTMDLHMDDLVLADVLREVRGTIAALAARGGLSLDIDVAKGLPSIRADRARVRQIVLNLASNAIKYTPEGGTIELSARRDGNAVEVSVSDTGVGIPKSVGDRVFDPFYQVEGVRSPQGQESTGLGLALVKRLVEAHGGRVSYSSRRGGGTTFVFTLPIAAKASGRSSSVSRGRRKE